MSGMWNFRFKTKEDLEKYLPGQKQNISDTAKKIILDNGKQVLLTKHENYAEISFDHVYFDVNEYTIDSDIIDILKKVAKATKSDSLQIWDDNEPTDIINCKASDLDKLDKIIWPEQYRR